MGSATRITPLRLAEKLLEIRVALRLSQSELVEHLGLGEVLERSRISLYELGQRQPPLLVLLRYAEIANVFVDVLIDDRLDLPEQLPSRKKHAGLPRDAA